MHHAFKYISLPSLHNYDVNVLNFSFYGERKQAEGNFLSLSELGNCPLEFKFRRVHLHLTKSVGRNNRDKDWKNANSLFKRRSRCRHAVGSYSPFCLYVSRSVWMGPAIT